MKHPVKRALAHTLFASGVNQLLFKKTALVVAFHRVKNTRSPEQLTVSLPLFERYCEFFKRHFSVVPLPELIDRLERNQAVYRELAITFDDGYADNFEYAAPVLESLSLPATFFVVTQWIGSTVVPWWDQVERVRHGWMTWDQVRSLHGRGFDVGAHTRTHADLGAVHGADAAEEICGARHELERQLGSRVESFAYPYGKRRNLAEANRQLVRRAGYRCCCSCFGGVIHSGTDPYRLPRIPISQADGLPDEFGLDVALSRTAVLV